MGILALDRPTKSWLGQADAVTVPMEEPIDLATRERRDLTKCRGGVRPRADLRNGHDEGAARVVAAGGGLEAIIEATDLRTRENVLRLIDPAILEEARRNDAAHL